MNTRTAITCPRCGRTSYSSGDIANGYCGWCRWWTSDPILGLPEAIAMAEREGAITPYVRVEPKKRWWWRRRRA